ncbi:universal stress protein [Halorutilales archaeon Cl-col2-1]
MSRDTQDDEPRRTETETDMGTATDSEPRPDSKPRILIPVELPESQEIPTSLVEFLSPLGILILGYYELPEQTASEQARDQFGDESQDTLEAIVEGFSEYAEDVESTLVFTHDSTQTVERVADDEDCDVVLVPENTEKVERILVPVRGDVNFDSIADVVGSIVNQHTTVVKLVHVAEDGEGSGDLLLRGGSEKLTDEGIDPSLIETEVAESDDPVGEITEFAKNYDVVVMGETEPSIKSILMGEVPERVSEKVGVPVLLVRHRDERPDTSQSDNESPDHRDD